MAILRAGPWGELGDEFQDPVAGTPTGVDPSPVNCAKNNWANEDWGQFMKLTYILEVVQSTSMVLWVLVKTLSGRVTLLPIA